GYQPGDHVTGTVRANYFFGKPVDGAEIGIKASAMDVTVFEAASVRGRTESDGSYRFDLPLPKYFAGRPLSHGAARVLIEATVKDSAGHAETRGGPFTLSESPLLITAVAARGTRRVPRRRAHPTEGFFHQDARGGVCGHRQGRTDGADARRGTGKRPGGPIAHGHAGAGRNGGHQRLPLRQGRSSRRGPSFDFRAAGGRSEDRDGGGYARLQTGRRGRDRLPRDQLARRGRSCRAGSASSG